MKYINKILIILSLLFLCPYSYALPLKEIVINGNDRVSDETIKMFMEVEIGENLSEIDTNEMLKKIYQSNFFKNVSVKIEENKIKINVVEFPIIQNVKIEGIKAQKNKELIRKNLLLKSRSSLNDYLLIEQKEKILSVLKSKGYYFAEIDTYTEDLENNMVNLIHKNLKLLWKL